MKSKKYILKIITLGITAIFLGGTALSASAASSKEVLKLSKEQAVKLAKDNNNDLKRLETGLETLDRKFKKYKKLSQEVEDAERDFENYKKAYKKINSDEFKALKKQLEDTVGGYSKAQDSLNKLKEQLKALEAMEDTVENGEKIAQIKAGIAKAQGIIDKINAGLAQSGTNMDDMNKKYAYLQAELVKFEEGKAKLISAGLADKATGAPKSLSKKEEYNTFIKPKEIPWYHVQSLIEKTMKKRELANSTIDVKVKEAYENLLYAKEGYNIKKQLYDRMVKGYNDISKAYEVGMASSLEKKLTKIELDKVKLDLDNIKRNIENGEIQFKKAAGIDLAKDIELKDSLDEKVREPKKFETYLTDAFKNRIEIFDVNVDLKEAERTMEFIEDYLDDDDYEWMDTQKSIDEGKVYLDDAKKDVEKDIQNAYLDVIQKKREIELASKNVDKSKQQLNSANKAYEIGTKPISLIWDAELGFNKAKMDYNTALRNYKIALYKLEKASTVGPKY